MLHFGGCRVGDVPITLEMVTFGRIFVLKLVSWCLVFGVFFFFFKRKKEWIEFCCITLIDHLAVAIRKCK